MTSYYSQPTYLAPETRARSSDINALNDAVAAAFDAIPATDQTWTGLQDFSGGTLRAASPISAPDVATRGYVDTLVLTSQGKFSPPPAQGTYTFMGVNGVVSWVPATVGIFDNNEMFEDACAISLYFS